MVSVEQVEAPAEAEEARGGSAGSTVPTPLLTRRERRAARIGTVVAVLAFWLLATGGTPWHLFDRGGFTTDFYDAQAHSLLDGRLDVPLDVVGLEGFAVDGRTQIYFGLSPAVLRVPLVAWGDGLDGRLAVASELVAVGVLGLASARLLARARRLVDGAPSGRPWWFAVGAAAPALATPVVFLASGPLVYHEAALWGAASALLGLDLVLRWHDSGRAVHLAVATAVAVFALSTRPSTGLAPAVALGLFGLAALVRGRWKRAAAVLACSVLPLVAFAAVNDARFGTVNDIPFPRQVFSQMSEQRAAALEANDGSLFGPQYVATNLARYLAPWSIRTQQLFPFVGWAPAPTVYGDAVFDSVDHTSSFPVGAPVLTVLGLVGAWWTVRRDRGWTWRAITVAAASGLVSTFTIAAVAQRYLVDLVPLATVLAAPGVWVWARRATRWPRWAAIGSVVLMAAVALLGTWTQLGLAFQARAFSMNPSRDQALDAVRFQYDLDGHLFGGAPPQVRAMEAAELPDAADGDIVILGSCAGLYRYDGYSWGPLERAAGEGRRLVLTGLVGSDPTVVASGDGWEISVARGPDGPTATYRAGDLELDSVPFDLPDGEVTLDVVADPATDEMSVSVGDEVVLAGSYLGATSGLTAGPGWRSTAVPAPVCQELLGRLDG